MIANPRRWRGLSCAPEHRQHELTELSQQFVCRALLCWKKKTEKSQSIVSFSFFFISKSLLKLVGVAHDAMNLIAGPDSTSSCSHAQGSLQFPVAHSIQVCSSCSRCVTLYPKCSLFLLLGSLRINALENPKLPAMECPFFLRTRSSLKRGPLSWVITSLL